MSKTIVVVCGCEPCGAVIAKRVVPDVAAEQAKALVPQVMHCPNFEKGHPGYPDVHVLVRIEPGPVKAAPAPPKKPIVVESGALATLPPTEPPPPMPEGATLGMTHLEPPSEPESRVYEQDEIPQGEVPAETGEVVVDETGELGDPKEWWGESAPSDGSNEPETPGT